MLPLSWTIVCGEVVTFHLGVLYLTVAPERHPEDSWWGSPQPRLGAEILYKSFLFIPILSWAIYIWSMQMLMQKLKHSFSLKKRQRWPKQICMLAKNTCLDVRWWTEIVVALKPIRKIHIEIKCVVPLVRRVDPISSCILHDDSCQFPRSLDS